MQNKILAVLLLAGAVTYGVRAQDTVISNAGTAAIAQPTPMAPAPAAAAAPAPAPNQVIYLPRLPSAAELTNTAAAQGLAIEQISETGAQVVVVYKYGNGQTNTVAYQLLPTSTAPVATTTTTVVTPAPAPTVVYQTAPSVVYYETYRPYYYPRYYAPPVSLHLGFGYSHFHGGGRHRW